MSNFECKCQVCVESKYADHSYKSVEGNYNPLEFIYTDIYDMKSTPFHGGIKYLVTFIHNCIRNDYIYLLNGEDEAI